MESKFGKYEQYLSDELGIKATISEAYLLKIGFIKLQLKDSFAADLLSDNNNRKSTLEAYVEQLYESLLNSPHIMDVNPSKEQLLAEKKKPLFYKFWASENIDCISLDQYLKLRVVLPKKKRDELFKFFRPNIWSPEQFTIYFNGATFAVFTPISKFPVFTYIGQVAREFLVETVGKTNLWEHIDGFGPTPIHPEFYVLVVQNSEQESRLEQPLASIDSKGDVFILLPSNLSISDFIGYFLQM